MTLVHCKQQQHKCNKWDISFASFVTIAKMLNVNAMMMCIQTIPAKKNSYILWQLKSSWDSWNGFLLANMCVSDIVYISIEETDVEAPNNYTKESETEAYACRVVI